MAVAAPAAVELCVEWLWEIREKLLAHEYLVLLFTVRVVLLSTVRVFAVPR